MSDEASMKAALEPFGWVCGPEFWERYYSDAWLFNLANAVEQLTEQRDELLQAVSMTDGPRAAYLADFARDAGG